MWATVGPHPQFLEGARMQTFECVCHGGLCEERTVVEHLAVVEEVLLLFPTGVCIPPRRIEAEGRHLRACGLV